MQEITYDLYKHFGIKRPSKFCNQGYLTTWKYPVPEQVAVEVKRQRPAILIMPGGAYRFVSDRESEPVALHFAAAGYIPFILKYSCAPCQFPVSLREAAFAMRFIRENAEAFGIAIDKTVAMGFSAGGHLCGMLGTMYDCPEVADIGPTELLRPDALALC